LCFANLNSSCKRLNRTFSETAVLNSLLASISLVTVTLNLLVIVSISHFRQLHTPTNALLLSLAVSDLLVGLLVMPIEGLRYVEMCWRLGKLMCVLAPYVSYSVLSASVGNMVLISIDRYLAICDPLLYSNKVTLKRAKIAVCVCWAGSVLHNGCILIGHLKHPERYSSCHGECVVVIDHISGTVDLFITFFAPCTIMVVMYMRVFAAAVAQMRVIRLQNAAVAVNTATTVKKSEWKAARTLGIVVSVFLMCFCPYYYPAFAARLMDSNGDPWLCFANLNSSCKRLNRTFSETAVLNSLLASISLVTVTLNLLVIISISHFRQLHTPTNALLLSLAVSDLLVGLLVMPIESLRYVETCWLLGSLMCALTPYVSLCIISASVGTMVLISIDRYLAICDPLLYSNKVTLKRAKIAICVCWACSLFYNGCILMGHLKHPERQLHTPTNALLLSLAVSDLLVGLLVMPIESLRYVETCWLLGSLMCALTPYVSLCIISASVGTMVLISIDRYLAICDPLLYSNKLHTPTNALLLSLAVSDLLVGLLVMPIEGLRYVETCWLLGSLMCALTPYVSYSVLSASVGNMVLISIDRYLAICDPLLYSNKLHTPTNALLLSLAVSDLLVGLLVMPIESLRYVETCWLLGSLMCALTPYVSLCIISASVGTMVLISIDRYLAICDPLLYSNKVTLKRAKIAICVCWACSLFYNGCILMGHLKHPERYSSCHGECVVVIDHISGTADLFITVVFPCAIMVVMYMRVFAAAVAQMRVIRLQNAAVAVNTATTVKKSEWKAARTLGIVIAVFLMCFLSLLLSSSCR
ncbi:unnamed protein product, partial [Tetraodon nigroviridis]